MVERKVRRYWIQPRYPRAGDEVVVSCLFRRGWHALSHIVWYRKRDDDDVGSVKEIIQSGGSLHYNPTLSEVGFILEVKLIWEDGSSDSIWTPEVGSPGIQHRLITLITPLQQQRTPLQQQRDTIRVISYNVLSEYLRSKNQNDLWFYDWNYRRERLMDEMKEYEADIICLQEVFDDHYDSWLRPEFEKLGYKGVIKMKNSARDGCAIFFLAKRFRVLLKHEIDFHTLANEVSKEIGPPRQKVEEELVSKGKVNIALCLLFEKLDGSHENFCVANTHMIRPNQSEIVSLFQTIKYVQEVEKFAAEAPFILCGNFNISPDSVAYRYVTDRKLEMEVKKPIKSSGSTQIEAFTKRHKELINHLKPLPRATSLASAYANFNKSQYDGSRKKFEGTYEPWFTIKSKEFLNVFDYIFYSDDSIHLCGVLELPALTERDLIPSLQWPSDHIALMGVFAFKARDEQPAGDWDLVEI